MYKLTDRDGIMRLTDNTFIPINAETSAYQRYLAWIAEGNTPEPADAPVPAIPQSVSMRQGREALIRRGYFDTVNTYIMGMAGMAGDIARNEWEMSQVIERNRPLTLAMAQLISLDAAGMDELFTYASTL